MAGDCELRKWEEFMTTILAVNGFARIGRRSELGPGDGMMLRRRLIRSDEAWHDALTTSSRRSTSVADRLARVAIEIAREISCRLS
jgi:hypothetical protein